MFNTRDVDLRRLNSATKYPSIPTYHALGDRGALLDEHVDFADAPLIYTEKIDGTNSRIVLLPDGCYIIGSREEPLFARGDLIANPALGIVDALRETADRLAEAAAADNDVIRVYYLETFGGKTTKASKQYASAGQVACRLFDACRVPVAVLEQEPEQLARWRDAGGQQFAVESELSASAGVAGVELTPRLTIEDRLPTEIVATHDWLQQVLPATHARLDDAAGGEAEGIVARTQDRGLIAKIRFEDYRRHIRRLRRS